MKRFYYWLRGSSFGTMDKAKTINKKDINKQTGYNIENKWCRKLSECNVQGEIGLWGWILNR
jgi:hypothetical protein